MEFKDLVLLRDELFEMFTPREQKLLEMRYQDKKTWNEIGQEFSITSARARQIEQEMAMKMLRAFIKNNQEKPPCTLCGV